MGCGLTAGMLRKAGSTGGKFDPLDPVSENRELKGVFWKNVNGVTLGDCVGFAAI